MCKSSGFGGGQKPKKAVAQNFSYIFLGVQTNTTFFPPYLPRPRSLG